MKKILLTFLVTAILMASLFLFGTGYFLGGYVVQFGLQRGTADNHQAPPRAYALIMPPSLTGYTKPDFPAEDWHLEAADGTNLAGTHFSPRGWSHRWAIVVHGYGCTQANSWYLASHYLHMGYHVVTPDLRGAGMSDGGFVTLGHDESRDIHLWAEKIVEQDPQAKIVLHGVSMGAATVMLAAAGSDATRAADEDKAAQAGTKAGGAATSHPIGGALPPEVVAVVEDSGYTSAYDLIAWQLESSFGLPSFPLLDIMNMRCEDLAGFSLKDASPYDAVAQEKLPILFIHGTADTLVPPEMAQILYDHATAPKQILLIDGALHAVASQKDEARYFQTLHDFLEPYMGK